MPSASFTFNRSRSNTAPSSSAVSREPRRRANTCSGSNRSISPPPALRARLNSKDIPRTYSGLYGTGGQLTHQTASSDLLPFELSRNVNTDWLLGNRTSPSNRERRRSKNRAFNIADDKSIFAGISSTLSDSLLWAYLFFIALTQILVILLPLPYIHMGSSFTITNLFHGIVTIVFLHWLKGSPNFYEQGELNAMTLWEQLNCTPDTGDSNSASVDHVNSIRKVLVVVPTVLCYVACHFAEYAWGLCAINMTVWAVCVVAKLDGMNGVRLWGINRTIGIDDDQRKAE